MTLDLTYYDVTPLIGMKPLTLAMTDVITDAIAPAIDADEVGGVTEIFNAALAVAEDEICEPMLNLRWDSQSQLNETLTSVIGATGKLIDTLNLLKEYPDAPADTSTAVEAVMEIQGELKNRMLEASA